jgi:hypothetical protein
MATDAGFYVFATKFGSLEVTEKIVIKAAVLL